MFYTEPEYLSFIVPFSRDDSVSLFVASFLVTYQDVFHQTTHLVSVFITLSSYYHLLFILRDGVDQTWSVEVRHTS